MTSLRFIHTRLGLLLWTVAMISCGSFASTYAHNQHAATALKSGAVDQESRRGNPSTLKWSSI